MTEMHDRRTGSVMRITPRVPQPSDSPSPEGNTANRVVNIENRAGKMEAAGHDVADIVNYVHMRPTEQTLHTAEFDLNMRPTVPPTREHLYDEPMPDVERVNGKIKDYGNVIPD
jgi:hypothetical protein